MEPRSGPLSVSSLQPALAWPRPPRSPPLTPQSSPFGTSVRDCAQELGRLNAGRELFGSDFKVRCGAVQGGVGRGVAG